MHDQGGRAGVFAWGKLRCCSIAKEIEFAMSEPLLRIRNHHSPSCGDPPIVGDEAGDCYVGYFENRYGEQWIFTFDRGTNAAVLRGGDAGWNSGFTVIDGVAEGLVLNNEEQLWLRACWAAAHA